MKQSNEKISPFYYCDGGWNLDLTTIVRIKDEDLRQLDAVEPACVEDIDNKFYELRTGVLNAIWQLYEQEVEVDD
jgi:hypothetical protein